MPGPRSVRHFAEQAVALEVLSSGGNFFDASDAVSPST
jgi:hypothetical protein